MVSTPLKLNRFWTRRTRRRTTNRLQVVMEVLTEPIQQAREDPLDHTTRLRLSKDQPQELTLAQTPTIRPIHTLKDLTPLLRRARLQAVMSVSIVDQVLKSEDH